jgi:glutamate--cysteine ligase
LTEEKGWKIEDMEDGHIFTLRRGTARTTVEADGKPEIVSSPHSSLHDVADEIKNHKQEIDEISEQLGISWITVGIQPFSRAEDIPLLPKKRYEMWDHIFPDHHTWMHTYMKALAGTHVNFGYMSEENLIRKTQVLLRLSPLLAAMFANSPYAEGKRTKCWGTRRHKIFTGGPGQEKMMSGILKSDFSLKKWIEWYVDLPVILFQFDQSIEVPKGFTFRTWMKKGYQGRFPTFFDFDQHLKTRWTDIRFRPSYLELRVFDTLPYDLLMASAAFIKGIIFHKSGWEAVENITRTWTEDLIHSLHLQGCKDSLQTNAEGRAFLDIAKELM